MRDQFAALILSVTLLFGTPAQGQDRAIVAQPANEAGSTAATADPNRIAFDINAGVEDEDDGDWGLSSFMSGNNSSPTASCGTDSDLLAAQSTSRPRYDDNGALIRSPARSCTTGTSGPPQTADATAGAEDRRGLFRQPDCVESASGYRCASTGASGASTYEREHRCEESGATRTCSSTFSIGNSEDGRNAAREALERLRDD